MIYEIDDRKQWNKFLLSQPTQAGIFLQSWQWGEFQKAVGRKVWRLGVRDQVSGVSGEIMGVCEVVKTPLPMGRSYLYSPRGPIIDQGSGVKDQVAGDFVKYIKNLATQERGVFWRSEPPVALNTAANEFSRSRKFVRTAPVQPSQTLMVDLTQPEEKLLAAMHEKTRYNIRLALRKGVETRRIEFSAEGGSASGGDTFWKLMQETAKRDGFRTHPKEYYRKMLSVLGTTPLLNPPPLVGGGRVGGEMHVRLHMAYHDMTLVAAAIVAYFGDTVTYLHGASSYEHRALMGPYALHWAIMQEAKREGYKFYDFWGIAVGNQETKERKNERTRPLVHKFISSSVRDWSGMTRFKMGFGGTVVNYSGTFDLPLSRFWYTVYRLGRRIL